MKKLLVLAALSAMAMGAQAAYTYTVNIPGAQSVCDMGTADEEDISVIVNYYFNMKFLSPEGTWAENYEMVNDMFYSPDEDDGTPRKFEKSGNEFAIERESGRLDWALLVTDNENGIVPGGNYSIYLATSHGSEDYAEFGGEITLGKLVVSGTFNTDSPTPAPEPTSGLLLLLGVAGLALKRKRA